MGDLLEYPVYTKKMVLTPKRFMEFMSNNRDKIKSTQVVPVNVGEKGFGKIEVTIK